MAKVSVIFGNDAISSMFFSISSNYGKLTAKAKVVRKVETNPSKNKYSNYYGCVLLQTDNKLSRHITDIQREAIKVQKQKQEEEELDKALGRLEKGILSNSIKKQQEKKVNAHGIKGIKTVADMEQAKEKQKQQPRPKIEGIKTATDEQEKKDVQKQPRSKVEGIVTMDEVQEKLEKKKDDKAPQPQIEGIKTAGLK